MSFTVVVLAAGHGRRFRESAGDGRDKLLEPCAGLDGVVRPVLEQVLRNVTQAGASCLVVTRSDAPERVALAQASGHQVLLISSDGMGDSLAAAVRATAHSDGWLVTLGDMPWVRPQTLLAVGSGIEAGCISVPLGAQGRGHPVGFGGEFAGALMALNGDQGGRRLFTADNVREVRVEDEGIYRDVDVPADLQALSPGF